MPRVADKAVPSEAVSRDGNHVKSLRQNRLHEAALALKLKQTTELAKDAGLPVDEVMSWAETSQTARCFWRVFK